MKHAPLSLAAAVVAIQYAEAPDPFGWTVPVPAYN